MWLCSWLGPARVSVHMSTWYTGGVIHRENWKIKTIAIRRRAPQPPWLTDATEGQLTETKCNSASKVLSDCIYANAHCWSRKIQMSSRSTKYKIHLFEDARNSLLYSFTAHTCNHYSIYLWRHTSRSQKIWMSSRCTNPACLMAHKHQLLFNGNHKSNLQASPG